MTVWEIRASRLVKARLALSGVNQEQLAERLKTRRERQ
jgi:hypothetical protein